MIKESDVISIIENETPNTYHVISKKIGELGIIYRLQDYDKFVFKAFGSDKFFKAWHLANILNEINKLNKEVKK